MTDVYPPGAPRRDGYLTAKAYEQAWWMWVALERDGRPTASEYTACIVARVQCRGIDVDDRATWDELTDAIVAYMAARKESAA